jgi:flavin reductase (DIM6/NTAB) family NADH-FMN oxidoreductase RutF
MHCSDITVVDAGELTTRKVFGLLKAAVVPRPVAWTSTVSPDGIPNLAPFSFFTVVSSQPPMVLLSVEYQPDGRLKDSAANIAATGEFVVNIAPAAMAPAVDLTSAQVDPAVDEFALAGLTPAPCRHVRPPRIAETPISLECRLHTTVQPGSDRLIIGEVVAFHLDSSVLDPAGRVNTALLDPVARTAADFARLQPLTTHQQEM